VNREYGNWVYARMENERKCLRLPLSRVLEWIVCSAVPACSHLHMKVYLLSDVPICTSLPRSHSLGFPKLLYQKSDICMYRLNAYSSPSPSPPSSSSHSRPSPPSSAAAAPAARFCYYSMFAANSILLPQAQMAYCLSYCQGCIV